LCDVDTEAAAAAAAPADMQGENCFVLLSDVETLTIQILF
jgi:hypothetical protein